jgi:CheY-like chemotaxis protein
VKQGAGLTVLVVDDYAATRELIRTLLESKGCHVVEAANGQEAVNIAARIAFSFILMDLDMPVLNGYEATREILSRPGTKGVPIIAFSANCSRDWQERALDAGCKGCISKPADFTLIDRLVRRYSSSTVD